MGKIEAYLSELERAFKEHGVVLAYLFGSQAEGNAGPLSDVDMAVLFSEGVPKEKRFDKVCLLIGELMGIFHRNDVYVVDLGKAPPLLKNNVRVQGKIIYCADESRRVDFEVETLRQFEDTKPLRQVRYYYLLRRIRNGTFGYPTRAQAEHA